MGGALCSVCAPDLPVETCDSVVYVAGDEDLRHKDVDAKSSTTEELPEKEARELSRCCPSSPSGVALDCVQVAESVSRILDTLATYVDQEGDVCRARSFVSETLVSAEDETCQLLKRSELYTRLSGKLDDYERLRRVCCDEDAEWFQVSDDSHGTIHACFDPQDKCAVNYRVRVNIPARLTQVMAVINEVQFMRKWNPLVSNDPQILGLRTSCHFVLNYCLSIGGLYKVEILNEIQRFCDSEAGILAEHIRSVPPGHPNYKKPRHGFKAAQTELKNLWIACGSDHTLFIQVGKVRCPFALTKWLVSSVGLAAGRKLIGGLVKNSLMATEPGNMWEPSVEEDDLGFYRVLNRCVESQGSIDRRPSEERPISSIRLGSLQSTFSSQCLAGRIS